MSEKLWGGRFSQPTDKFVEEFTASIQFDQRLYRYDIQGSIAHCRMLAKQGIIQPEEAEPPGRHPPPGVREDRAAGDSEGLFPAGRKMEADVPVPHRPVDRVGHGMQENVPVGVTEESRRVVDPHPPQPQFPTGNETVGVPPEPDPEIGIPGQEPRRHPQVLGKRNLEIRLLPGKGDDGMAGRLDEGGVVRPGASLARGEGVRLPKDVGAEPLRGLGAEDVRPVPRHEGARRPVPRLHGVADGDHRHRRAVRAGLRSAPPEQRRGGEGPRR